MKTSVVVPTLNSIEDVKTCINALKKQSYKHTIIVVANGTVDGTQRYLAGEHPDVIVLSYIKPLGFAGAVNAGIKYSIKNGYKYIGLLNNDAVADRKWLEALSRTMDEEKGAGIVTSKIKHLGENKFDSTGDYYTSWFLPYPRGRGLKDIGQYDEREEVLSASGGASLYSVEMFKKVGLFDEDFYAYYEDVDISLRARHQGWRVIYEPTAVVEHKIGGTSSGIRGFTTLQTMKNLPLLFIKNVPFSLVLKYWWKFYIAHSLFFIKAFTRFQGYYAIKGAVFAILLTPRKLIERRKILSYSKLSAKEFDELLIHDLPPNAILLRKLRKLVTNK